MPLRRSNPDEPMRRLEREAALGDQEAAERLRVARKRAGQGPVDAEQLEAEIRAWWKKKKKKWGDLSYGVTFYSPAAWKARGERWGDDASLVMTSEGGFNRILEYPESSADFKLIEEWKKLLEKLGYYMESYTVWAFGFYPLTGSNPRGKPPFLCTSCRRQWAHPWPPGSLPLMWDMFPPSSEGRMLGECLECREQEKPMARKKKKKSKSKRKSAKRRPARRSKKKAAKKRAVKGRKKRRARRNDPLSFGGGGGGTATPPPSVWGF